MPEGAEGDIVLTVEVDGAYSAKYRGLTRQFQSKPRISSTPPGISIVSLLPNPAGEDRVLEEVHLRNDSAVAISLAGWFLRDQDLRVWTLTSLGTLPPNVTATIRRNGMAMDLDNTGESIELLNNLGVVVDRAAYGVAGEGVRFSF